MKIISVERVSLKEVFLMITLEFTLEKSLSNALSVDRLSHVAEA